MANFWTDFLANFIATILGLVFGIPIALWLDRVIAKKRQKEEAKNVLSTFKDELGRNLKLMGYVREQLRHRKIETSNQAFSLIATTPHLPFNGQATIKVDAQQVFEHNRVSR